jgi:uncharacterized membrane protein
MGDGVLVIDENSSWLDIAYVIIQGLAILLILMLIIVFGPTIFIYSMIMLGRGEGYDGCGSINTKPQRPINNTNWQRRY